MKALAALLLSACATAAAPGDLEPGIDAGNRSLDAESRDVDARISADASIPIDAPVAIDAGPGSGSGINGTCAHPICSVGADLDPTCSTCTDEICAGDPYCCVVKWDAVCVGEVGSVCGDACP